MKKNKKMKENSFLNGAFIATMGIVGSKILGMLYVIPFYAIIGEKGGALYGYAYTIYTLFQSLSCAGIPNAVSKIISEYQTLGYYNVKERAFKLGKRLAAILGVTIFILLFIFAPNIATAILGDLKGGNTIADVTFVIRVIATAILIVPNLSICRGYLEGHKFITPSSISQVVEQVARVFLIIIGSFVALHVFHLSLTTAVGIAVFGATFGALIAYFYLIEKMHKNKAQLKEKPLQVEEPQITTKSILKKIFWYALPFIMIDIFKSAYDFIDMTTIVKTLVNDIGYKTAQAENVMSVISTWGSKLNMIIVSVSTGMIISLIPNLTASAVKGDQKDVHHKINQTLQILLLISLPMTIGLSMLSTPVWNVFYGSKSSIGPSIISYFIFVALVISTYTTLASIVQVLKYYKEVFISLITGVTIKLSCNVLLMNAFYKIGLSAVYGAITATILGYGLGIILCLYFLHKKCKVSYQPTIKLLGKILLADVAMILTIFLLQFILPLTVASRLKSLILVVIYTLIGAGVYFVVAYRLHLLNDVLGDKMINKIKTKLQPHKN